MVRAVSGLSDRDRALILPEILLLSVHRPDGRRAGSDGTGGGRGGYTASENACKKSWEVTTMTDRDFDQLLYQGADQLPPKSVEQTSPDPWRQALLLICWGIALTSITLNFLNLQYILPAVARCFCVWAFAPCGGRTAGSGSAMSCPSCWPCTGERRISCWLPHWPPTSLAGGAICWGSWGGWSAFGYSSPCGGL